MPLNSPRVVNLFCRQGLEIAGFVHAFQVDSFAFANWIWPPHPETGMPPIRAWQLAEAPTPEALEFMANAVERDVIAITSRATGESAVESEAFEFELIGGGTVSDARGSAHELRQALSDIGGRLVDVEWGENGSGQQRFTVDWIQPETPPLKLEFSIAETLQVPPHAVSPLHAPTSRDRFGLDPLGAQ